MTKRAVLVTGGAGYIGSHACKALSEAGWLPVSYDNLTAGHAEAVRWGPLVVGDIADRARLESAIGEWRPHAVLHFAAHAYVGESVTEPARYYRNNVAGSLTLLEAMKDHGLRRIVFSSTCATYGAPPDDKTIAEDTPQRPMNPYGATKLMVERMLADFSAAYGLGAVCLRYFNAAGADPDGMIGEWHDPETHLLPLAIEAALGLRAQLTIHGVDYPTPDGTCIRDYVHVGDLAAAHVAALGLIDGAESGWHAFNLGLGRGFSVRDIVTSVERVSKRPVPVVEGARRQGDPARLVSDASRARAALGWTPAFTDLDAIVQTAWNWAHSQRAQEARA